MGKIYTSGANNVDCAVQEVNNDAEEGPDYTDPDLQASGTEYSDYLLNLTGGFDALSKMVPACSSPAAISK